MAKFKFTETVGSPLPEITSCCLGTGSGNVYDSLYDLGKPVVMAAADNYVISSAGGNIEGIIDSVEPGTHNSGYSFGGVRKSGRIKCIVGPNQGGTAMAVLDLVVADVNPAAGTLLPNGYPIIKTGTPTTMKWRVISIVSGTGTAGSIVLIERI